MLAIALPLLLISHTYWRGTITDVYYLKNANFLYDKFEIIKPNNSDSMVLYDKFTEGPYFNVSLHRLKKTDRGVVFIIRSYRPNPPFIIDADRYQKITISIPELKNGHIALENRKDVRALFTKGGSAWPSDGCMKVIDNGFLDVNIENKHVKIKLQAKINCGGFSSEVITIAEEWDMTKLDFLDLNPWLGSTGDHPYAETMRR